MQIFSILEHDSTLRIGFFSGDVPRGLEATYVSLTLPIKGNDFLRAAKENDTFIVRGTIASVQGNYISLKDASIEPSGN